MEATWKWEQGHKVGSGGCPSYGAGGGHQGLRAGGLRGESRGGRGSRLTGSRRPTVTNKSQGWGRLVHCWFAVFRAGNVTNGNMTTMSIKFDREKNRCFKIFCYTFMTTILI